MELPIDKVKHAAVGTVIGAAVTVAAHEIGVDGKVVAAVWGVVVATVVGAAKEFYDWYRGGVGDPYDIAATFAGGVLGAVVAGGAV